MALIKSKQDIVQLKKGGQILGRILEKLAAMAKSGVSTWEIDQAAEKMVKAAGGRPSFKGYASRSGETPFPCVVCVSINHELVHGIAKKNVILKTGDILSIDIGMERRGCFMDTAITVPIGKIPAKTRQLLNVTQESLEVAIKEVKAGISVATIGRAIEKYVKSQGNYGIVRDLVGHGVGHAVHEEPRIPNYYDPQLEKFILKPGMVLAIEPMISLGDCRIKVGDDNWTIEMADCSLCAHFEHTVVVTEKGCTVVTRRPKEL